MDATRSLSLSTTALLLLVALTSSASSQSQGGAPSNWLTQPAPGVSSGGGNAPGGGSGQSGNTTGVGGWITDPKGTSTLIQTKDPSGNVVGGGVVTQDPSGKVTGWDPFKNLSPAPTPTGPGTTMDGTATDRNGTSKVFNTRDADGKITGGWVERYDANGKLIAKEPFSNTPAPSSTPTGPGTTMDGTVTDRNGTSKVFNTRDADGNITGGWIERYDANGKLVSKEPFSNTPAPSSTPTGPGTTMDGTVTDKNGTSKVFNTRDANGNITGGWIEHYDANGKLVSKEPFSNTPAPTPPPNGPGDYVAGTVTDKNGTTKLVYTKDAQGNVVGGYYLHYDATGKLLDKEPFNGTGILSPSSQPTQAALQGAWSGTFSGGGASGSLEMYVSGAAVHGTVSGYKTQDGTISGSFSGTVDAQGGFGANMSGSVAYGKGVAFAGHLSGTFSAGSASGSWAGAGGFDKASGTWSARKK